VTEIPTSDEGEAGVLSAEEYGFDEPAAVYADATSDPGGNVWVVNSDQSVTGFGE
jgi:hypothetical protein